MAAAGIAQTTNSGSSSYTKKLIAAMKDFGNTSFNAAMLQTRLLGERYRKAGDPMPVHIAMTDRPRMSIFLPRLSDNAPLAVTTSVPAQMRGEGEPRVIVSLSLDADASPPNIKEWTEYISSQMPSFVSKGEIRITGIYQGHSSLVKLSCRSQSGHVWRQLPD